MKLLRNEVSYGYEAADLHLPQANCIEKALAFASALSVSKKSKIRIVGGGVLDAPAVKHSVFYLLPANL